MEKLRLPRLNSWATKLPAKLFRGDSTVSQPIVIGGMPGGNTDVGKKPKAANNK